MSVSQKYGPSSRVDDCSIDEGQPQQDAGVDLLQVDANAVEEPLQAPDSPKAREEPAPARQGVGGSAAAQQGASRRSVGGWLSPMAAEPHVRASGFLLRPTCKSIGSAGLLCCTAMHGDAMHVCCIACVLQCICANYQKLECSIPPLLMLQCI